MKELSSNAKGVIAETAIELAAHRCNIGLYRPASGHSRADMLFEIGGDLYRVQVKWASLSDDGATVLIHTSGSRLTPRGYVRSPYRAHEIDLLAAYCDALNRCFLLPLSPSPIGTLYSSG